MNKIIFVFLAVLFTIQLHAQLFVNGQSLKGIETGQYIRVCVNSEIRYTTLSIDYGQLSSSIGVGDRIEGKNGRPYKFKSLIDGINQLYDLGWEFIPFDNGIDESNMLFKRRKDFEFN